ncbi:YciI family protein [Aliikangiella coralliicola]|uniref:YciI family protein n=1 Tax=Aliikangiella coralliicola TaxID=2592383 RepID=A0A545UDC9_9GAMM|nr:YciI family protein [Aliikangiella coralliicola]TQV87468.1 YciI family protein [Aliikangiella coralliicola]
MLYAVISQDVDNSLPLRKTAREAHLQRLQQLKQQGRLIVAGPHPAIDNIEPGDAGFTGSLIVAEFSNLQTAEDWAASDPYIEAGVYKSVVVKPFNMVLP